MVASTNYAVQSLGYQGKFNVRGTDFSVHNSTLSYVRNQYEKVIRSIEDTALRWVEKDGGRLVLEGYAIHFIPIGFEIPIEQFFDHVFDGTRPFRLAGVTGNLSGPSITAEVVDLHTADRIRFELHPDIMTAYLREGTCGNTIARFYTNLQHYFGARFTVESDNGIKFFEPNPA